MAFVLSTPAYRSPPSCHARRGGNSGGRRPRQRRAKGRPSVARLDPILYDGDVDTTDITTYVSCPTCFNSLMLRPAQLAGGPLFVRCNCCERRVRVALDRMENVDGSPFDSAPWLVGTEAALASDENSTDGETGSVGEEEGDLAGNGNGGQDVADLFEGLLLDE